ncbi:CRTAC1 family protein [Alienimonas sp. DA493]|uniref:CRTAC1 family protein n=1 Tax=Alienimonas sp. DA493 TaxID=3373605 RepID=UPI00375528F0
MPLVDVTAEAGLAGFEHQTGARGEKLLPETMGGGAAFFDFDADGDPDVLFTNSARWPWEGEDSPPSGPRLYRNDGTGQFNDVTAGSGLDGPAYGMGVACGDYNADGLPDVYLTALGENRLYQNRGGGRFEDVTAATGTGGAAEDWTTAAGWFDADGDGDLDLLTLNYLEWSREADRAQPFTLTGDERGYGRPRAFGGALPRLYRNDGDGRFAEVAAEAGFHVLNPATGEPLAKSLGLTFADVDEDGDLDAFVANDTVRNFLFLNQTAEGEPGRFVETGVRAGVAFDENGLARGAMGVDAATLRGDRDLALAIGNFAAEMTALYASRRGAGLFADEAAAAGLGAATRPDLTFGVLWLDADLDGRPGLVAANGHLEPEIARVQPGMTYAQPPRLFWNAGLQTGGPEFLPLGPESVGDDFQEPFVGRAVTAADVDLDGDQDLLLTELGGPPRLFRNDQALGRRWLRATVVGDGANPGAIGATVTVTVAGPTGPRAQRKTVNPTRGYLSQVELPLTFGLGGAETATVRVVWPDGAERTLTDVPTNRALRIERPDR